MVGKRLKCKNTCSRPKECYVAYFSQESDAGIERDPADAADKIAEEGKGEPTIKEKPKLR